MKKKYLLIIPDGMADEPQESLEGMTPLGFAETPCLDRLAPLSRVGLVETVPENYPPGSEIAIMNIFGYPPSKYFRGRGPMEARAQGIDIRDQDVVFRCNLVASDGEKLLDYSGGHISTDEARKLLQDVSGKLAGERFQFYPGVQYRHLLIWREGDDQVKCLPPHDVMGQAIETILPAGERSKPLRQLIWDSLEILDGHDINKRRRDEGNLPANMLWPWGQGKKFELPPFQDRFVKSGAVITAVDLVRGIARAAEMDVVEVDGATGYYDTDYAGKAQACLAALQEHDFVCVHVEATDEAGHNGNLEEKLKAIERVDKVILAKILDGLSGKPFALLLLPDHPTPVRMRTHVREKVPFLVFQSDRKVKNSFPYTEVGAQESGRVVANGAELLPLFFRDAL